MGTICNTQKKNVIQKEKITQSTQITTTPVMQRSEQQQHEVVQDNPEKVEKICFKSTHNINEQRQSGRKQSNHIIKMQIQEELLFGRRSKHSILSGSQI